MTAALESMRAERASLQEQAKRLDSGLTTFEDKFVSSMTREDDAMRSPQQMTKLIGKVEGSVSSAMAALGDIHAGMKKLGDEVYSEVADVLPPDEEAAVDALLAATESNVSSVDPKRDAAEFADIATPAAINAGTKALFKARLAEASAKLTHIFNKGKTQYQVLHALSPLGMAGGSYGGPHPGKSTGGPSESEVESIQSSIEASMFAVN